MTMKLLLIFFSPNCSKTEQGGKKLFNIGTVVPFIHKVVTKF